MLERGEYEIPELARHKDAEVRVQEWAGDRTHRTVRGRVQCTEFPFIVITNNGERDFPPPFLRRCVRFTMPSLSDTEMLKRVVRAHLGTVDSGPTLELINEFAARVGSDVVSLILSKPPDPGQDGGDEVLVGLRTGLPVIVWSRADCDSEEFQATVQELLHGDGPGTILQRLRQIRRAAYESHSEHIGRHLVMLWDDPERLVSPGDLGPPRDPREASIA